MTSHPELVGGERRTVTRLMRAVPGLVAKDGADGVFAGALPDGRAFAVKIADGAERAVPAVVVQVLRQLGIELPDEEWETKVLGHGRPVGSVRAVAR
jgi:L-asparaginase II